MLLKLSENPEVRQFARFFVTGTMGFILDATMVFLLVALGVGPILARFFSLPIAYAATWFTNRYWTFAAKKSDKKVTEFARYTAVQLTGASVNFGVYSILLLTFDVLRDFLIVPLVAGSIAGMFITYFGSALFVFRGTDTENPPPLKVKLSSEEQ